METEELIRQFAVSREQQMKAIFSTLFIAGNRLQTMFDKEDPSLTLKQFMLLTMVHQAKEPMTFTQAGKLLGCSRQNVKKLALQLQQKGFAQIGKKETDSRAAVLLPTGQMDEYFEKAAGRNRERLQVLFGGYTAEETEQLFQLLMKLYKGMEELEK